MVLFLSARYAPVEGDQVPVLVVPDSPVLNQLEPRLSLLQLSLPDLPRLLLLPLQQRIRQLFHFRHTGEKRDQSLKDSEHEILYFSLSSDP